MLELAWAGGLFEGEGCIGIKQQASENWKGLRMQLSMCDEEPVVRFANAIGVGKVYGPYRTNHPTLKPVYTWSVVGKAAIAAAWVLYPWLGTRRRTKLAECMVEC